MKSPKAGTLHGNVWGGRGGYNVGDGGRWLGSGSWERGFIFGSFEELNLVLRDCQEKETDGLWDSEVLERRQRL